MTRSPEPPGQSAQFGAETARSGEWVRQANHFTGRVSAASSSLPGQGPDEFGRWPVEAGRYRLIVSLACPWAHRSVIVRRLLGLEDALSLAVVDPIRDESGWRFTLDPDGRDPVTGAEYLSELYQASDPEFSGRWTVPVLYDTLTRRIVSNDYPQLTVDLSTEWRELHGPGAPDLLPVEVRTEIDELNDFVYSEVNNGVYRAGFATTQAAYSTAYRRLFDALDRLSDRLSGQRFLLGSEITEADVRLFTTLVRFDAVYHGHFKCNRNKLTELPVLWSYARDLFQARGFGDTTNFDHIKRHYYFTHDKLNPSRVVPEGPDLRGWSEPPRSVPASRDPLPAN